MRSVAFGFYANDLDAVVKKQSYKVYSKETAKPDMGKQNEGKRYAAPGIHK